MRTFRSSAPFVAILLMSCVARQADGAEQAQASRLELEFTDAHTMVLSNANVRIVGSLAVPDVRPACPAIADWSTGERKEEEEYRLAGHDGALIRESFTTGTLELVREVWLAKAGDSAAVRVTLRNAGPEPIEVDFLSPIRCEGADSVTLLGEGAESWEALVQKRHKNGMPWASKLSGVRRRIDADPFLVLRPAGEDDGPLLLCGYLSQLGHCARILANLVRDQHGATTLDYLDAQCEFDGVVLPGGEERTSQWFYIHVGRDPHDLIADYVERVGHYHDIPAPPRNAPSAVPSCMFYGFELTEEVLKEDMEYLAQPEDHIPFDVFQFDHGWQDFGQTDYSPSTRFFPSGMDTAATWIRGAGYVPGIYWSPFAIAKGKLRSERPEWFLNLKDGSPYEWHWNMRGLDPTHPGVCEYLERNFRRMKDWGYDYFVIDFTRIVVTEPNVRFHDRTATRLEAYRRGLEAIRRGIGPDAYLMVVGGHFAGAMGLTNAQVTCGDLTKGVWPVAKRNYLQNTRRFWMSRLWHNKPGSMIARRQPEAVHGDRSVGIFSDDEIRIVALNQYMAGQHVGLGDRFQDLDEDRRALYRHVLPSINTPSIPLDVFNSEGPSQMLTRVEPVCEQLEPWVTVACINWLDEPQAFDVALCEKVTASMGGEQFLAFDFFEQRVLGVFRKGDRIDLGELAPHSSRLIRIAPYDGNAPVLVGTDLHFSGGGVELAGWESAGDKISGTLKTIWPTYPVRITVVFPAESDILVSSYEVPAGQTDFEIFRP